MGFSGSGALNGATEKLPHSIFAMTPAPARHIVQIWQLTLLLGLFARPVSAHDPVFAPGPHVLFKDGVEIAAGVTTGEQGVYRSTEPSLELTYGLTGDWAAGLELPYAYKNGTGSNDGPGDARLFTKYRFWRKDSLGVQQSAAVLGKIKLDTSAGGDPSLGSGSTDGLLGVAYGYESRKWYRWASVRYRVNGENGSGLRRGNKLLVDIVGGIRFKPTAYDKPDTVWLLELNSEYAARSEVDGHTLKDSGGTEWFISPGVFWTLRNFAIKAGVQIPFAASLNGYQNETDYRARVIFEWHL